MIPFMRPKGTIIIFYSLVSLTILDDVTMLECAISKCSLGAAGSKPCKNLLREHEI